LLRLVVRGGKLLRGGRPIIGLGASRSTTKDVEGDVLGDPCDPGLEGVAAVEPVEALIDPDHRLLEGLVAVMGIREEPLTHTAGERPVAAMDLDERLRVPGLEIQDEETVIQGGIAAQRVALVGNSDDQLFYLLKVKTSAAPQGCLSSVSRPGCRTVARDMAHLERPNGHGIGALGSRPCPRQASWDGWAPSRPRMGSRAPRDLRPCAVVGGCCEGR